MSTTLYEKRGRRYVPLREYSPEVMDAMPSGSHLVVVSPGSRFVRFNVEPDHATLLAALREHREALLEILRKSSAARARTGPLSPRERRAYEAYCKVMGHEAMLRLEVPAATEILDTLEKRLVEFCHE